MAEKLQTVLARGILNTRMRDYYDIHILKIRYANDIKNDILKNAFKATCMKRGTEKLLTMGDREFEKILHDNNLIKLWKSYQEKYSYAKNISYEDIIGSVKQLVEICINVVKSIPTT
jgi:hypothetical protein